MRTFNFSRPESSRSARISQPNKDSIRPTSITSWGSSGRILLQVLGFWTSRILHGLTRTSLVHAVVRGTTWGLTITYNFHLRLLVRVATIRGMTMADSRRKPRATRPPPTPEIVPEVSPQLTQPGTISMSLDMVQFFLEDPAMERRRIRLDSMAINHLIAESLMRRGVDPSKLTAARWLWVGTPEGLPALCLILPGAEA